MDDRKPFHPMEDAMNAESLVRADTEARRRAASSCDALRGLQQAFKTLQKRQTEILAAAVGADAKEFGDVCRRLFETKQAIGRLKPEAENDQRLVSAIAAVRHDWKFAMPGHGGFGAWFLVRSFRLEDGKPVAYDPFWAEELVEEGPDGAELRGRKAADPGKDGYARPAFALARPFGKLAEAATAECGACGQPAAVVGFKDLAHWCDDPDGDWPYRQELHAFCFACPRLTLLAERQDDKPARLHP
jgi:hypothetical protein